MFSAVSSVRLLSTTIPESLTSCRPGPYPRPLDALDRAKKGLRTIYSLGHVEGTVTLHPPVEGGERDELQAQGTIFGVEVGVDALIELNGALHPAFLILMWRASASLSNSNLTSLASSRARVGKVGVVHYAQDARLGDVPSPHASPRVAGVTQPLVFHGNGAPTIALARRLPLLPAVLFYLLEEGVVDLVAMHLAQRLALAKIARCSSNLLPTGAER